MTRFDAIGDVLCDRADVIHMGLAYLGARPARVKPASGTIAEPVSVDGRPGRA